MMWLQIFLALASGIKIEDGILVLDDENFTEALKDKEALVLFYNPLCGASKIALEELKTAAKLLEPAEGFVIGKINLMSEIHIANAFKIKSDPRLVYFTASDMEEYNLKISYKKILSFIDSKLNPKLKRVSASKLSEFLTTGIVSFLLVDGEESKLEWKIARSLRFDMPINIAMCTEAEALGLLGLDHNGFYAINTYHQIYDELTVFTYETIVDFVLKRDLHKKLPLPLAFDYVIDKELPAVYIFRDESTGKDYENVINETISEIKDMRIIFGDLNYYKPFSDIIGFEPSRQPAMMIIEPQKNTLKKYISYDEISRTSVLEFINLWKSKEAKSYFKSAPAKKGTLVGSNFKDTIENTFSDVLVHFYADWCEHCSSLEKTLEIALKNITNIKVLKINAEENEIQGHTIEEYPTLKFYNPQNKKWFVFRELQQGRSELDLPGRIGEFIKHCRKDKRSSKSPNEDL